MGLCLSQNGSIIKKHKGEAQNKGNKNMKTSIVRTDVWKDDELYKLNMDSKFLYMYILTCPERGNARIFKFNKREASLWTGMTSDQIETAFIGLVDKKFLEVCSGYVAIMKAHFSVTKNRYYEENEVKELAEMPEEVRAYFIDKKPIPHQQKPAKKPKEDKQAEVKAIIAAQPEALQKPLLDFMEDRIERKKPATTGAVKRWITKLESMYPGDIKRQVASIEQSIERGWSGMYPVKDDNRDDREFM